MSTAEARAAHVAAMRRLDNAKNTAADTAARRDAAEADLARLTERVRGADPDDPGFADLAAERATATARAEALRARADTATKAVDDASRSIASALEAVRRAEIRERDERARKLAAQLDGEARAARDRLAPLAQELRDLVAEAHAIEQRARPRDSWSGPLDQWAPYRGHPWARSSPGAELFVAAQRMAFFGGAAPRACPMCGVAPVLDKGSGPFACVICNYRTEDTP